MAKEKMKLPVVFLPGLMCDSRLFHPQINTLSGEITIILSPVSGFNSVTEIATNILSIMPNRFALAGLSFGGIVALEMIRIAPERILKMALMDTSYSSESTYIANKRTAQILAVQTGKLEEVMMQEHLPNYLADGSTSGAISDLCITMAKQLGKEVFIQQSRALISRIDQTVTLQNIDVPTMILCGAYDRLCNVQTHQNMANLIKGSSFKIVPDAGHLPTLENPTTTNRILREWLN